MTRSAELLEEVEAFLLRSGMTPTMFGKTVASDPNLVRTLREGRRPNVDLAEKCQEFIATHEKLSSNSET